MVLIVLLEAKESSFQALSSGLARIAVSESMTTVEGEYEGEKRKIYTSFVEALFFKVLRRAMISRSRFKTPGISPNL